MTPGSRSSGGVLMFILLWTKGIWPRAAASLSRRISSEEFMIQARLFGDSKQQ
jgi:hypothetical protein